MPTDTTPSTAPEPTESATAATPPPIVTSAPRTPTALVGRILRRMQGRWHAREARLLLIAANVVLAAGCWFTHRAAAARERHWSAQTQALARMQEDAGRIETLSTAPARAVEQRRSSADLLAQIESSLNQSGIPLDHWQDSLPQPGQRLNDSPYTRHTTRLYLEEVNLRQLAAFGHALIAADPALTVSALRLTASGGEADAAWNADLAVTYLTTE